MNKDTNSSEPTIERAWRTMSCESEEYTLTTESTEKERDAESGEGGMSTIEGELEKLMDQVISALPIDEIQFDEALLKENLEDVLVMLISLHVGTHGKELLLDLTHFFATQLSPATLYPCLHELEEEDLLVLHLMVRTKEYSIEDEDAAHATIEHTMDQHLAFGLLLYAFLSRL